MKLHRASKVQSFFRATYLRICIALSLRQGSPVESCDLVQSMSACPSFLSFGLFHKMAQRGLSALAVCLTIA